MKRLAAIIAAWAALVLGAGCGQAGGGAAQEAKDALIATDYLARQVVYEVDGGGDRLKVVTEVEDDYRYRTELAVDGEVAYEEVVSEDVLVARLVRPSALPYLIEPDSSGGASPTALVGGGWVRDDLGAPNLAGPPPVIGQDPIIDSLTHFGHIRSALDQAEVRRFDADALEYRPDEDPFPRPDKHVIRYDLVPTPLPSKASAGGTAPEVPDLSDLRRMSVYVRDGIVVAVRELVDIGAFLRPLERTYGTPPGDGPARAAAMLKRVNDIRAGAGQPPVEPRSVVAVLERVGTDIRVTLPATATPASLQLLRNRGSATGTVATAPAP